MFSLCHGISFFFFFVLMIIYTEQSSYVRHRQHGIKRRHPSANNAFQAPGTCLLLFFSSFINSYQYFLTELVCPTSPASNDGVQLPLTCRKRCEIVFFFFSFPDFSVCTNDYLYWTVFICPTPPTQHRTMPANDSQQCQQRP